MSFPWQYSDLFRSEYLYHPKTDEIILKSGLRYARPPNVPRDRLQSAAYDGPLPVFQPQHVTQTRSYQLQQGPGPGQLPPRQAQHAGTLRGGYTQPAGRRRGQHPGPNRVQPRTQPTGPGMAQVTQAMGQTNLTSSDPNRAPSPVQTRKIQHNGAELELSVDPRNSVQVITQNHPPTPRDLQAEGIVVQRSLVGTAGNAEKLFPEYKVRQSRFFCLGRVFLVLWAEPAGSNGSNAGTIVTMQEQGTVKNHLGERVFSKVRRFVVIRESEQYCNALPITTYSGRGVAKRHVIKSEHAIIYTGRAPPLPQPDELASRGENGMRPIPIRVDPDNQTERLDPMSRIHFGGVHQVQHNIKTKSLGIVSEQSIEALQSQFANVWQDPLRARLRATAGTQRTTAVGRSAGVVGTGVGSSRTVTAPADTSDGDEDDEAASGDEEEASGEEDGSDDE